MIKQTIPYVDYNGKEQIEDFYFNLTKLEIMEMELNFEGGLSNYIQQLTETTAGAEAYNLFKKIILESHGRKSTDGRHFWKIDPDSGRRYADEFVTSPAMTELIFGFLKDGNDAAAFVRGLLPDNMVAEVEAEAAAERAKRAEEGSDAADPVAPEPVEVPENVEKTYKPVGEYTKDELLAMSQEDFDKVAGTDASKMTKPVLMVAFQRKSQN